MYLHMEVFSILSLFNAFLLHIAEHWANSVNHRETKLNASIWHRSVKRWKIVQFKCNCMQFNM